LIPEYWLVRGLNPLVQCVILLPSYAGLILGFGIFRKEEIETFRKSFLDKWRTFFKHSGVA
jgi:hypothetical protein